MGSWIGMVGAVVLILSVVIRWSHRETLALKLMATGGLLLIFWPSLSPTPYGVGLFIILAVLLIGLNLAEEKEKTGKKKITLRLAILTIITLLFTAWWIR